MEQALPVFRVDGNQAVVTGRIVVGLEAPAAAEALAAEYCLTPLSTSDDKAVVDTADKVGPVPYEIAGRDDFMGFGRLNVLSAVRAATPAPASAALADDLSHRE